MLAKSSATQTPLGRLPILLPVSALAGARLPAGRAPCVACGPLQKNPIQCALSGACGQAAGWCTCRGTQYCSPATNTCTYPDCSIGDGSGICSTGGNQIKTCECVGGICDVTTSYMCYVRRGVVGGVGGGAGGERPHATGVQGHTPHVHTGQQGCRTVFASSRCMQCAGHCRAQIKSMLLRRCATTPTPTRPRRAGLSSSPTAKRSAPA